MQRRSSPGKPLGQRLRCCSSSPTPPRSPRSAFSGLLPSQASFRKMQDHLHTADLRPQLSHLLQQELHLLGFLRAQNGQLPARQESRCGQRAAHRLWGASELSKRGDTCAFPALPVLPFRTGLSKRQRQEGSPGALAVRKMSAGGTRSADASAQNHFQLRNHLLPPHLQVCRRHTCCQLLRGKNAPLEHPLPEPPGLPRRGFPGKTRHKLLLLWVTLRGSRRGRDFSSHCQQRVTDLYQALCLHRPRWQRGPAVNTSCNSHHQETVILPESLAIPAAALSPAWCPGGGAADEPRRWGTRGAERGRASDRQPSAQARGDCAAVTFRCARCPRATPRLPSLLR